MKVFISWSGALSRALAVELREWLPMVVQQVDAWISTRDIDPGQRWALVLGQELEKSDFAIVCLTPDNRQSPWLLFEAGAVARMNKLELIQELKDATALSKSEAAAFVDIFFNVVAGTQSMEERVEIRSLCSIFVKE
jgi:hypothetical protein